MSKRRKRHTPEQIIRKLREAGTMPALMPRHSSRGCIRDGFVELLAY